MKPMPRKNPLRRSFPKAGLVEDAQDMFKGFTNRVINNIKQGQKDWKSGKIGKYGSINPFK